MWTFGKIMILMNVTIETADRTTYNHDDHPSLHPPGELHMNALQHLSTLTKSPSVGLTHVQFWPQLPH